MHGSIEDGMNKNPENRDSIEGKLKKLCSDIYKKIGSELGDLFSIEEKHKIEDCGLDSFEYVIKISDNSDDNRDVEISFTYSTGQPEEGGGGVIIKSNHKSFVGILGEVRLEDGSYRDFGDETEEVVEIQTQEDGKRAVADVKLDGILDFVEDHFEKKDQ